MADPVKFHLADNKQFVYEENKNSKKYFRVRQIDLIFKGFDSTAIILQDETVFEELKRLDEKYQRLYLASVVHDIRTPIHGILGMLEMIEHNAPGNDIQKYVSVARNSAKLLIFFTYDITDYSQIEAKTISVNNDYFSPTDVISECMQILEFNFTGKGVQLNKFVEDRVPYEVFSDKIRFMQIMLNLLGNALKFTFKGEVNIYVQYNEVMDMLIVKVADTGVGIKHEDMPKLFRLFSKIRENAEVNPTGVGLGLAVCKKLTELLGGDIRADSEYGKGSIFTFTIKCNLYDSNILTIPTITPLIAEESDSHIISRHESRTFVVRESILSQRRGKLSKKNILKSEFVFFLIRNELLIYKKGK